MVSLGIGSFMFEVFGLFVVGDRVIFLYGFGLFLFVYFDLERRGCLLDILRFLVFFVFIE